MSHRTVPHWKYVNLNTNVLGRVLNLLKCVTGEYYNSSHLLGAFVLGGNLKTLFRVFLLWLIHTYVKVCIALSLGDG